MLSIIICSRDAALLRTVRQHVAETVGVSHEVIGIDNSQNRYGICEAYNVGAAQARFDLLCFMHEDLRLHTPGWGRIAADILADPAIGVLGVAGGQLQLRAPSSWWFAGEQYRRMRILHTIAGQPPVLDEVNPHGEALADVAVLDGVWLCSRREVWAAHPFDARTFSEFHFYDIDYCTALYPYFRVCVTYDILLEHFSKGSVNRMWVTNCAKYYAKWQAALPFGPVAVAAPQVRKLEADAIYHFIDLLMQQRLPLRTIRYWLGEAMRRSGFERRVLGVAKHVLKHRLTR